MNEKYNVYLVSDSTGETLDRVFLTIKTQFKNIDYNVKFYFFPGWHQPDSWEHQVHNVSH